MSHERDVEFDKLLNNTFTERTNEVMEIERKEQGQKESNVECRGHFLHPCKAAIRIAAMMKWASCSNKCSFGWFCDATPGAA